MTELSMYVNPASQAVRDPAYYTPRDLATHLTATVVYSLSGATVFLLATFIRSI